MILSDISIIFLYAFCFVWLIYEIFLHAKVKVIFFYMFFTQFEVLLITFVCIFYLDLTYTSHGRKREDLCPPAFYPGVPAPFTKQPRIFSLIYAAVCLSNLPVSIGLRLDLPLCSISLRGYFGTTAT